MTYYYNYSTLLELSEGTLLLDALDRTYVVGLRIGDTQTFECLDWAGEPTKMKFPVFIGGPKRRPRYLIRKTRLDYQRPWRVFGDNGRYVASFWSFTQAIKYTTRSVA